MWSRACIPSYSTIPSFVTEKNWGKMKIKGVGNYTFSDNVLEIPYSYSVNMCMIVKGINLRICERRKMRKGRKRRGRILFLDQNRIQLTWIRRYEIRWHSRLFSGTEVVKELQESVTLPGLLTNAPSRVTVQWAVPFRIEVREQVIYQSIQGPRASTSPRTRHGIGHPPHQETYQGSVVRALWGIRASFQPKDQPRTRRQSCTNYN